LSGSASVSDSVSQSISGMSSTTDVVTVSPVASVSNQNDGLYIMTASVTISPNISASVSSSIDSAIDGGGSGGGAGGFNATNSTSASPIPSTSEFITGSGLPVYAAIGASGAAAAAVLLFLAYKKGSRVQFGNFIPRPTDPGSLHSLLRADGDGRVTVAEVVETFEISKPEVKVLIEETHVTLHGAKRSDSEPRNHVEAMMMQNDHDELTAPVGYSPDVRTGRSVPIFNFDQRSLTMGTQPRAGRVLVPPSETANTAAAPLSPNVPRNPASLPRRVASRDSGLLQRQNRSEFAKSGNDVSNMTIIDMPIDHDELTAPVGHFLAVRTGHSRPIFNFGLRRSGGSLTVGTQPRALVPPSETANTAAAPLSPNVPRNPASLPRQNRSEFAKSGNDVSNLTIIDMPIDHDEFITM